MSKKKRKPLFYTFLIVPDNDNKTHSLKLGAKWVKILTISLVTVAVLIILGFATYWQVASVAIDYVKVKEDNFKLRKSLETMEEIKNNLQKMRSYNEQIRTSLSGYVSITKKDENDTTKIPELDFSSMPTAEVRTIFNTIPSLKPVDGFVTRGYQTQDLLVDPHYGLDIAAEIGTPVKSAADGIVMFSGWTNDAGHVLVIQHEYGYVTIYKHNQRNLVQSLEKVTKGQVIALVGNTGEITSGSHLHFEIWKNGLPLDPQQYISTVNK